MAKHFIKIENKDFETEIGWSTEAIYSAETKNLLVLWKDESSIIQVQEGDTICIDCWGGFPGVMVMKKPKDKYRKLLWENKITRRFITKWGNISEKWDSDFIDRDYGSHFNVSRTISLDTLKFRIHESGFVNSNGQEFTNHVSLDSIAYKEGNFEQFKKDIETMMGYLVPDTNIPG
ncbi:hypothetical protein HAHI6034_11810 [Hathewaya histolytica]|uniref:Uncharacterized protein n=2 Tax=Hathewaya histolytica TaxID=1498 RepID=A0A4U9RCD7_HATHI|nr:Uncharacterised protein [Hathewaya histolytica]